MRSPRKTWVLIGADGSPKPSRTPGKLGGHSGTHIYGKLDCPAARRAIARGGYVRHRVFFRDAVSARAAGYRPCAVCMPREYARWKTGAGRSQPPSIKRRRAE